MISRPLGRPVSAAVFVLYLTLSMLVGGMLRLAPGAPGGGHTGAPAGGLHLQLGPIGITGTLAELTLMVLAASMVGLGVGAAVSISMALSERRHGSSPSALVASSGLTPVMVAVLTLGACCSTAAAAAAGLGLAGDPGSGAPPVVTGQLIGIIQAAVLAVALLAQEALLTLFAADLGLGPETPAVAGSSRHSFWGSASSRGWSLLGGGFSGGVALAIAASIGPLPAVGFEGLLGDGEAYAGVLLAFLLLPILSLALRLDRRLPSRLARGAKLASRAFGAGFGDALSGSVGRGFDLEADLRFPSERARSAPVGSNRRSPFRLAVPDGSRLGPTRAWDPCPGDSRRETLRYLGSSPHRLLEGRGLPWSRHPHPAGAADSNHLFPLAPILGILGVTVL